MSTQQKGFWSNLASQPDTLAPPTQRRSYWSDLASGSAVEEEETAVDSAADSDANPLESAAAGFFRALTEPLSIIGPVNEISESMKPFYGTSLVTKIPYGLGFAAGTLIPGSLLYKVGGRVARGLGLVEKLID